MAGKASEEPAALLRAAKRGKKGSPAGAAVYIIHKKVNIITENGEKIDFFVEICYNISKKRIPFLIREFDPLFTVVVLL